MNLKSYFFTYKCDRKK